MKTTWFQVLYSTKGKLDSMEQFNKLEQFANRLDTAPATQKLDDGRIRVLKEFLATFKIMDNKHVALMTDSMHNDHLNTIAMAVQKFYDEVDKATLDDKQRNAYNDLLTQIIFSQGAYLNKNKRKYRDDLTKLSDDEMDTLFKSFNELKNGEKSLQKLVRFIYVNNFDRILYKNITGNDPENSVPNDVLIAPYIINALTDSKQFDDDAKQRFYLAFVETYKSDREFLDALKPVNKDFVKLGDADANLVKILEVYKDVKIISYSYIKTSVNSLTKLRSDAPKLAARFKGKFTTPTFVLVIDHVDNYMNGMPVANSIINDANKDDVLKEVDDYITLLFDNYSNQLKGIIGNIDRYNKLLAEEFHSQTKTIAVKDGIKLWNDFHASNMYKYYGKYIDVALKGKVAGLLKTHNYSLRYGGKDIMIIKSGINILDMMDKVDIDAIGHNYESFFDFINATFAKSDMSVSIQIQVEIAVLIFIKGFLSLDYKTYDVGFKDYEDLLKKTSYSFDAICNLVYARDKFIKESAVVETFMFGGYVITESEDNVEYFNKLADRIRAKTGKPDEKSLTTYVAKYAGFEDDSDEQKSVDSSVLDSSSNGNVLSDEQINTEKQAAQNVVSATDNYKRE